MSVILLPPSEVELQDAIDFYNDQMAGLGGSVLHRVSEHDTIYRGHTHLLENGRKAYAAG